MYSIAIQHNIALQAYVLQTLVSSNANFGVLF